MIRWLRRWTWDTWKEIHEASPPDHKLDWRPLFVLVLVAVSLTIQDHFGDRGYYAMLYPRPGAREWAQGYWELNSYAWWALFRVGGFLVLPVIAILLTPGLHLRDMHLSFKGFFKHLGPYLFLLAFITPVVIIASRTAAFQHTYPFYRLANRSTYDLLAWEGLYVAQFLSLEFFFRGFMLATLRRSLGVHAIWVMMVPYVMIHFGKPVPETLGAIFAGVVLGTLAMKMRSIWGGVLVHCAVAIGMDLLALQHCPPDMPCQGRGAMAVHYDQR